MLLRFLIGLCLILLALWLFVASLPVLLGIAFAIYLGVTGK